MAVPCVTKCYPKINALAEDKCLRSSLLTTNNVDFAPEMRNGSVHEWLPPENQSTGTAREMPDYFCLKGNLSGRATLSQSAADITMDTVSEPALKATRFEIFPSSQSQ